MPQRWSLFPVLLVLVLIGLALFGDKGVLRALQAGRQRDALQREVQGGEEANDALRREIEALRSDRRHIESIARRELGMVKEDELVYQFSSGKKDLEKGQGGSHASKSPGGPKESPQED
ncbi:septum formation initiator family protein [Desulfuromonas sp.]|uniref:FtsB family cell division protein n=1 Tax=Desulfuromonas sp. TaxID=892 RepID=UPI0025C6FF27|nr:septum formation initiator family protein [Desulfuromonas sp.]